MDFEVNFDKLASLVSDLKLVPLTPIGGEARKVKPSDIPYLSEYFEKSHLSWFSDSKYFTVITFIDSDSIDERAEELLNDLIFPQVDDPEIDKVKAIATLVADYPCYFATIVSYQNGDPDRIGRPSYEIICRANKVVIKSSNYQYNPKDMS
jgi:hypothetical protein